MTKCEICGLAIAQEEFKEHLKGCIHNLDLSDTSEQLSNFHRTLEALDFLRIRQDLEKGFLQRFVSLLFESYLEELRKNEWDITSIFDPYFFPFLRELIRNNSEWGTALFREEAERLLQFDNPAIFLILFFEDFLDHLSIDKKIDFISKYGKEKIISIYNNALSKCKLYYKWYNLKVDFSHFRQLREFGIKLLMKLYISTDWYVQERLLSYLVENITEDHEKKVIRGEISEYFCKLDYPEIMLLFESEKMHGKTLLQFLQEEDYKKMLDTPNSNIIEKLMTVIQKEEYSPYQIEDIFTFLGPRRVELYLMYIRKADETSFEPFREMGKDIFEPFLRDVILNQNHYQYHGEFSSGESALARLYQIFFDSMTKEELTDFLFDKKYNIIERLIEIENQEHFYHWSTAHDFRYFFYYLFLRIDDDTIMKIYDQIPDDLRKPIHHLFFEQILESPNVDEFWIRRDPAYPSRLKEAQRIFPLLATKDDILDIIHIIAIRHRIIHMDALEEKLRNTDFSNVNYYELLKALSEFYIVVNERKTYECSEGKLILDKYFLGEIIFKLRYVFRWVIAGVSSSGIKKLIEFLKIVLLIGEDVFYLVETYISEEHAFNMRESMDFKETKQIIEDYFDLGFDTIVSIEGHQRSIKIYRYLSTGEQKIEKFTVD